VDEMGLNKSSNLAPKKITKGFIVDTVTTEKLIFQHNPNEFQITRTPNWATSETPGMSHPKMQFINGGVKKISFTLNLYFDDRGRELVIRQMDWLEALTYPDYDGNGNFNRGAHPVLFNFGDMVKNMRAVVTNYQAKPYYLFDPTSLLPLRADIDIELTEFIYDGGWKPIGFREVRIHMTVTD
jgi:hypothetical protein